MPAWSSCNSDSTIEGSGRRRRLSSLLKEATASTDENGRRRSWSADPDIEVGGLSLSKPKLFVLDPDSPAGLQTPPSERSSSFRSREARDRRRKNSLSSPVDDFFVHTACATAAAAEVVTPLTSAKLSVRRFDSRRQSAPEMVVTAGQRIELAAKELRWLNLSELVEVMRRLRLPETTIAGCLDPHLPHNVGGARDACSQIIMALCKDAECVLPVRIPVPPPSPTRERALSTPVPHQPSSPVSHHEYELRHVTAWDALETLKQGVVVC